MSGITEVSGIFGQNSLSSRLRPYSNVALLPCRTNSVKFDTAEKATSESPLEFLPQVRQASSNLRQKCGTDSNFEWLPCRIKCIHYYNVRTFSKLLSAHAFKPQIQLENKCCTIQFDVWIDCRTLVELMSNAIQLSSKRQKCDIWIGHKTLRIFEQIRTLAIRRQNCLRITYLH